VVPGSDQDRSFLFLVQLLDWNYCHCTNNITHDGRVALPKRRIPNR